MIFKTSYIVTENNGVLRCEPAVGTRQIVAVGLAAVASILGGIAVFSMLSANLPARNRVTWTMGPAPARTAAHVVPKGPIVMTTARVVPSKVETAGGATLEPRS